MTVQKPVFKIVIEWEYFDDFDKLTSVIFKRNSINHSLYVLFTSNSHNPNIFLMAYIGKAVRSSMQDRWNSHPQIIRLYNNISNNIKDSYQLAKMTNIHALLGSPFEHIDQEHIKEEVFQDMIISEGDEMFKNHTDVSVFGDTEKLISVSEGMLIYYFTPFLNGKGVNSLDNYITSSNYAFEITSRFSENNWNLHASGVIGISRIEPAILPEGQNQRHSFLTDMFNFKFSSLI